MSATTRLAPTTTTTSSFHDKSHGMIQNNNETMPSLPFMCTSAVIPKNRTCEYHAPPAGVDYSDNDTVFGQILRGESPAQILAESNQLLAFQDIHPRAPLHGLIIPKRYIEDIASLTPLEHIPLLLEMHDMAMHLLQQHHPTAFQNGDYILCFHVPPFTSVSHLHLHVLAPASRMALYYKKIKYTAETRWCTSYDRVLNRLESGKSGTPYYPRPSVQYKS